MNPIPFKINQICYDSEAKEYVKLSNGTDGMGQGPFVPTEAIALRVVCVDKGIPQVAYTYRAVNPARLTVANNQALTGSTFDSVLSGCKHFVGRI